MTDRYKDSDSDELFEEDDLLLDSNPYDSDRVAEKQRYLDDAGDMDQSSDADEPADADDASDADETGIGDDISDKDEPEDEVDASDSDDYYNDDEYEEPTPAPKPKQPKLNPEDPDYWLDEQSEFDHILPKPKNAWKWWLVGSAAILALLVGLWIWFFRPYVDGAVKYGYIKSMERRGTFVKTFEGVLIPYRELGDQTPTYFEPVAFSVDGDSLAAHMKGMMLGNVPVRLEYEVYHHPLFWKGASEMVIVAADTADVKRILPPEYQ